MIVLEKQPNQLRFSVGPRTETVMQAFCNHLLWENKRNLQIEFFQISMLFPISAFVR